jgi:6-phosphogluconolactonase
MKNILLSFLILPLFLTAQVQITKFNLLIGTFTNKCDSKGIYVYEFDAEKGDFKFKNATDNVISPGFLTVSEDNKYVYSVNSDADKSAVSAFGFEPKTGKLNFINKEYTRGENPCYIINDDKNVITANYTGGSVSVFGKNNDGSLTELKQLMQHQGKGPNAKRQDKSHLHLVQFSPDKKYVLGTDLGTDKVYLYKYFPNSVKTPLTLKDSVVVKAGSGPRHLTFSKNGKYLYLLQELDGTVSVFKYKNGNMKLVQETSVLSDGFNQSFTAADIHISPDERFLYATNRKEANDISCFKILKNGKLEFVSRTSTLGDGPRNFAIDPTGNFLLVGHQFSNDVVVFKRDKATGLLTDTGKRIELCSPVCLVFTKE